MAAHARYLKAFEQPIELALTASDYTIIMLSGPLEVCLLQALVPEAETGLVSVKEL